MTNPSLPSERRRTKTRQEIINKTYQLICTHGVDGASLRTIADRLDYSPSALYRYFSSKEELVDAVRAQCFERLNKEIFQHIQTATTFSEKLLAGALVYLDYARRYPVDYHLMFYLPPSPATQSNNHEVAMSALLYLVRSGIEQGEFFIRPDYGESAIVYHCWSTVHGLAMLETSVMQDEQDTILQVVTPILKSVIAGFSTK